jgi:hypothetical protein
MEKECPPEKALEKFLTKLSKAVEKDEDGV